MNLSMRLMTLILEERKQFICTFKKYFSGTSFTRLPFLKRLKEKHKLGDVCVSGKASRFDTVFFFFCFDQEIPVVVIFFHPRVVA